MKNEKYYIAKKKRKHDAVLCKLSPKKKKDGGKIEPNSSAVI